MIVYYVFCFTVYCAWEKVHFVEGVNRSDETEERECVYNRWKYQLQKAKQKT